MASYLWRYPRERAADRAATPATAIGQVSTLAESKSCYRRLDTASSPAMGIVFPSVRRELLKAFALHLHVLADAELACEDRDSSLIAGRKRIRDLGTAGSICIPAAGSTINWIGL